MSLLSNLRSVLTTAVRTGRTVAAVRRELTRAYGSIAGWDIGKRYKQAEDEIRVQRATQFLREDEGPKSDKYLVRTPFKFDANFRSVVNVFYRVEGSAGLQRSAISVYHDTLLTRGELEAEAERQIKSGQLNSQKSGQLTNVDIDRSRLRLTYAQEGIEVF